MSYFIVDFVFAGPPKPKVESSNPSAPAISAPPPNRGGRRPREFESLCPCHLKRLPYKGGFLNGRGSLILARKRGRALPFPAMIQQSGRRLFLARRAGASFFTGRPAESGLNNRYSPTIQVPPPAKPRYEPLVGGWILSLWKDEDRS